MRKFMKSLFDSYVYLIYNYFVINMKNKKVLALVIVLLLIIAFFVYKSKKNIDIYINTNYYASKIEKIMNISDEYEGKRVSISGFIHYDEYGNCYIARNYVGSSGVTLVGLLLKGEYEDFEENEWVKVIGKINYKFVDYAEGTKVPYINIEKITNVKEQENDRIVIT